MTITAPKAGGNNNKISGTLNLLANDIDIYQWGLVIVASLLLFFIAPWSRTSQAFFKATVGDRQPNFWVLTSSLVISWIFAKSITNAANLGLSFGMVGGVAYAAYYLSFVVAGIVIYRMRTKGGFKSIHDFLHTRFGRSAVLLFSLLIVFRLFNEVWSNTMVIGTYFGEQGSTPYFIAIVVFTLLTLAYSLKGGLQSSLLTDVIQMSLFGVLLFIILGILIPREQNDIGRFISSGEWSMAGGLNLLFLALVQAFSYPFHDPVMTDRGFIAPPRTTLRSFLWAAVIGAICIILFSFVGIYGSFQGLKGQAAVEVSATLGMGMMLMMNLIMVTSAASTLDSTFSSFAKLTVLDLRIGRLQPLSAGRWAMVVITILGTVPIFLGPEILSATTISGTMVIGLAPVFVFWHWRVHRLAFHLSVGIGLILGSWYALGSIPQSWIFFEGKYGDLLSLNLIGSLCCFGIFGIIKLWSNGKD